MKKSLLLIMLLAIIFPLSACSSKRTKVSEPQKLPESQQIAVNSRKWDQQTKNLTVVHNLQYSDDYAGSVHSVADFKKVHSGTWVIKAKVLNLGKVISKKHSASELPPVFTRGEVKVDQVIGGSNKLNKKTINLVFEGGITSKDNSFSFTAKGIKKFGHPVLVQDDNAPLPKIGSEIILAIQSVDWEYYSSYEHLDENGFKEGTTFQPVMANIHFWVKEPGAKEFVLNNSLIKNKQDASPIIIEKNMTDEINQKYNN